MNRNDVIKFIKDSYGVSPEFLWEKYPNYIVFRHKDNSKWFAIVMDVQASKLGKGDKNENIVDIVDLKVAPEIVGSLRLRDGVFPAYHMNKEHWVSIELNSEFDDVALREVIDDSYQLTK